MKDALCKAFCESLYVTDVPIGLSVGTGFKKAGGDNIGFFVRRSKRDPALSRIEDDGTTVPLLEGSGVDFSEQTRAVAFAELMREAGADFDSDEGVLHTRYLRQEELPTAALRFVTLLVRMQDFMLVTRARVEETFKSDVIAAVVSRFEGRAEIQVGAPLSEELWETPPDIVVRPKTMLPLALFLATSNDRALEATVLDLKINRDRAVTARIMLVLAAEKPRAIKTRTRSLARELPSTVFPGREQAALDDMEVLLFGTAAPLFSEAARLQ